MPRELTDREMEVWERLRALDEAREDFDRRDEVDVLFEHAVAAFDRLRARPDTTSKAEGGEG